MESQYNLRSPAVKRLMKEAKELRHATEQYFAQPLEDNLFEWHFTVRGPPESDFDSGCYHGRIVLPPEYPMKPPSILLLTPNGRFEVGRKICLSISGHHPETWQPSWSIRTVLLAIIGFMPTQGGGAIGSLDYTPAERKILAKKSQTWTCETCGCCNKDTLKEPSGKETVDSKKAEQEAKDLASQISFKEETPKKSPNQAPPLTTTWPGMATNVQASPHPGMMGMVPNPYPAYAMTPPQATPKLTNTDNVGTDTLKSSQDADSGLSTSGIPDGGGGDEQHENSTVGQVASEENAASEQSNSTQLRHRVSSPTTGSINSTQAVRNAQAAQVKSGSFTLYLIWIVASLLLVLALRRVYTNMS